jgi:hypothetical protein
VARIVSAYFDEGRTSTRSGRRGRPLKLTDVHSSVVKNHVDDNCTIGLGELQNKLVEEFNLTVGKSTIALPSVGSRIL